VSHYFSRYCVTHGEWDCDVDNPSEDCPGCIEELAKKQTANRASMDASNPAGLSHCGLSTPAIQWRWVLSPQGGQRPFRVMSPGGIADASDRRLRIFGQSA
jgi:hypothetical protein